MQRARELLRATLDRLDPGPARHVLEDTLQRIETARSLLDAGRIREGQAALQALQRESTAALARTEGGAAAAPLLDAVLELGWGRRSAAATAMARWHGMD